MTDNTKALASRLRAILRDGMHHAPQVAEQAIREAAALIEALASPPEDEALERARDETGWLVEEDGGFGVIHWIALIDNIWERGWYISDRDQPSPVCRVKNSNEALRFARKQDAEAFISLFKRFLLCPRATEHCWHAPEPLPVKDALDCEELAIKHGQQVTITFKDKGKAFDLFNELKARARLEEARHG